MRRTEPPNDHHLACSPRVPLLGRRHVQIWYTQPGHITSEEVLCASERSRLDRFKRDPDRRRFVTAATLLRIIAGHHTSTTPQDLIVTRTCPDCPQPHGKPRLPGSGLEVSIAHAADRVVLAVTRLGPVGVDIERLDPTTSSNDLALSVLNAHEPMPEEEHLQPEAFLRYWTRKESVVKAAGVGLRSPLEDVVVTPHDQHARLLRFQQTFLPKVLLHDIHLGDDYLAAVAVMAPGPCEISIHSAMHGTAHLLQPTLTTEERTCA